MRVRARHVPVVLGFLAVGCEAVAFVMFLVGLDLAPESWFWTVRLLWVCGIVAAPAALVPGLLFDRRGPTVPAALLALFLAAVPMGPLLFLVSLGG